MIPTEYSKSTNFGERKVFDAFNGVRASEDWIVVHGLDLAHNAVAIEGESVFVVSGIGRPQPLPSVSTVRERQLGDLRPSRR